MTDGEALDLDELLDGQVVRRSTVLVLAVATLALVSDGFDIAAIGFAAPDLARQWQVSPAAMRPVFSAGIFGLLIGSPLLGFVGDRFGRKRAVVLGLGWAGLLTLACAAANSLQSLAVLRFLAGVGLGGVISNVIALAAEAAPKRWRGRFVVVVGLGVPIGFILPGPLAAVLMPLFGWKVLFLVGGVLSLVIVAAVALAVPESIRFLLARGGREDEVRHIARTVRPDLPINAFTRLTTADFGLARLRGSPLKLFAGSLVLITPALWLAVAANQMVTFFAISWLPTLLQFTGSSIAQASLLTSMYSTGGLLGVAGMSFVVDRFGAVPPLLLFVLGVPLVAAIGIPGLPAPLLIAVIGAAGFCTSGNNAGANATMGAIYPTPVRAMGVGWAQGVGRLGSLAAPAVGGLLLESGFPIQNVLLAPAVALAVGALAWAVLTTTCVRRFGGTRLREFALAPVRPPVAELPTPGAERPASPGG